MHSALGNPEALARFRAERRLQEVRKLTHFLLFDFHGAVQKLPGSTPIQRMLVERGRPKVIPMPSSSAEQAGQAPAAERKNQIRRSHPSCHRRPAV